MIDRVTGQVHYNLITMQGDHLLDISFETFKPNLSRYPGIYPQTSISNHIS
jgi:hypothetical protein